MKPSLFRAVGIVVGIFACLAARLSAEPVAGSGPVEGRAAYDIRNFGGVGDGETVCTEAIRAAIASAAAKGGGTIYFPAGTFLTGPIHLQSHITLFLDSGSVVKFTTNFDDYMPFVPSRWEGIEVTNFSPLIYAQNAEDIAIRGRGTLDGQGQAWWSYLGYARGHKAPGRDKWQAEFVRLNPHPMVADTYHTLEMGFMRPPFIQPYNCTNVLVEGVTIINSPFWTISPVYCENITVSCVTIHNPSSPNTDGIDPDSCRKMRVSNCDISVGDDCMAIKSGRDADGRRVGKVMEDLDISNCTMASGHGGVSIGSEASGSVKNIVVANCVFNGTDRGIRIKSTRGRGGVIEDIRISNIVMRNIKEEAILVTSFYERSNPEPVSERTPVFRNINISGITGDAKIAGSFTGLTEMPLENISMSDINLTTTTGISITDAKNVTLRNVTVNASRGAVVNADKTDGLELDGVRAERDSKKALLAELGDVKNVFVHGCSAFGSAKNPCLRISAASAPELVTEGNNFGGAQTEVVPAADTK